MSLRIIEPVQEYLKVFDTVQDFEKYYAKHRDDIDSDTTHMLNKKYHINGYRITRINHELQLKKDYAKITTGSAVSHIVDSIDKTEARVSRLEEVMDEMIKCYHMLLEQ